MGRPRVAIGGRAASWAAAPATHRPSTAHRLAVHLPLMGPSSVRGLHGPGLGASPPTPGHYHVFDRSDAHLIESGTLASLDNQVDTTTGTVRFRAEFPNKALALFPNQFVNARLLVQMLKDVTLVPTIAVQHNGTNDFVYVVKPDNTVTVQYVTALTTNEQDTAVQGLNAGVTIATAGFDRLENGAHVTVRTPAQRQGQRQAQRGPDNLNSTAPQ